MQNKALAYAEEKLGVHKVWIDAEALALQLQDLYNTASGLETGSRNLQTEIDRRRADLLLEEASTTPELSPTAFERRMKFVYAGDEVLRKLTDSYNETMAHRDAVNAQIRGAEVNLKGHTARMNELGGYFKYLASAKNAQTTVVAQVNDYPW
jgi:hexokinase